MFPTELWPPLKLVEATLDGTRALEASGDEPPLPADQNQGSSPNHSVYKSAQAAYLLLPLTELAKRRSAVAARGFSIEWASGRLVQITVNGAVLGVLLDRAVQGKQWTGWLAASESNWASSFDVLLEPCDDPFEPMFGVIQAWNPVTVHWSHDLQARIVCEISAMRLAAIRTVALECAAGLVVSTPVEPGRIALRTAGGAFSVLTGTPLGSQDLRHDYQNAYRTVAARLMALQLTRRVSQVEKKRVVPAESGTRAKSGFAVDWYIRPALVLMTVIVLVQNTDLLNQAAKAGMGVISMPAAPATTGLRVQWKPGASMDEVQQLLRSASTSVMDGPDVEGFYRLKSGNVMAAKSALSQSHLVRQVLIP